MTLTRLIKMAEMDIKEAKGTEVMNLSDFKESPMLTVDEKVMAHLGEAERRCVNPYFGRTKDGGTIKFSFSNNDTVFMDAVKKIF